MSRRRRAVIQPGWRCLEIAAGRGSMAAGWPSRSVLPATSSRPTSTPATCSGSTVPNLEVRRARHPRGSARRARPGLVRSGLLAFGPVSSRRAGRRSGQADGEVPAPRRLADRRGRRLGDSRSGRSRAPALRGLPARLARRSWWTARGYDKAFGQKLPALFERCGLQDIRHEAATEVVRGGSPWARWWIADPGGDQRARRGRLSRSGARSR